MRRKIRKRIITCFCMLMIGTCIGLCCMLIIKARNSAPAQTQPQQQETQSGVDKTLMLDKNKLNIELPKNLEVQDIEIINDYVSHTIYVQFPKAVDNYLEEYIVEGNRAHIEKISYYNVSDKGVIEIKLDKACEYYSSEQDGFLCMEIKDLHEVYEKVVVIDAGHGGTQPGAVEKDVYEKTINLEIVQKLKELLDEVDEKKLKVFYTRLEDSDPSLEERVNMANQLDANLFISVHNNASPEDKYDYLKGSMVLFSESQPDSESKRLAQICLDNVMKSAGSENQGLVKGDEIYIVRTSKVPVALIEVGYMTNTQELKKLCDDAYQSKVAQGIYNAIMQAFEEGF